MEEEFDKWWQSKGGDDAMYTALDVASPLDLEHAKNTFRECFVAGARAQSKSNDRPGGDE